MLNYSVLMSVYYKENPRYLEEAMLSILNQTVQTNDFVLVCDGPLTEGLELVIASMEELFGENLNINRLEKNSGLGNALNFGLKRCKNELVARMDSDDISLPNRIEKQLELFSNDEELSIASGTVNEFQEKEDKLSGRRIVPETNEEIIRFSKSRNPFNHPAVMFKKSHIEEVGSYSERFHLFEDYYLWIRLLIRGRKGRNIQEPILAMRVPPQLYLRRGGWTYAKDLLAFNKWLKQEKWIGTKEYLKYALPHALVCILPNSIRKLIYQGLRS